MKWKELLAVVAAAGIFVCVGCNYNRLMPQEWTTETAAVVPETTAETVTVTTEPTTEEPTTQNNYDFSGLRYSAGTAAACYDVTQGRYLYEKNTSARISPASLTKIVTACVALKYADPSTVYMVGDEVNMVGQDSSLCYIRPGHQVTLYDLLCGMLLASGNDAAYTIAVSTARTVSGNSLTVPDGIQYFVGLMNDFCAELGMVDSHFVNPDGWDDEAQFMSLRDIVTAADYAMRIDVVREIAAKSSYFATFVSGQTVEWTNSNQMMIASSPFYMEGIVGGKTGTTEQAGKCLIASYRDGSHDLLVASMGNPTDEERYFSVREMIDTVLAYS